MANSAWLDTHSSWSLLTGSFGKTNKRVCELQAQQRSVLLRYGTVHETKPLIIASSFRSRLQGLLATPPHCSILMLCPCKSVHTLGMKHAIDIAFVSDTGKVIKSRRGVLPGKLSLSARHSAYVLEQFFNPTSWWFNENDYVIVRTFHAERSSAHFACASMKERKIYD